MAKERDDRYQTARELADDLRRFLDRKPIQARRPSPLDRASRWARRHRKAVATAIALLLTAVVGLSVVVILIARAEKRAVAPSVWRFRQSSGRAAEARPKTCTREPVRIADAADPPPPADVPLRRLVGKPGTSYARPRSFIPVIAVHSRLKPPPL